MENFTSFMDCFLWIILGLMIYFIPFIVAANKEHSQTGAIFVLNLLLGWTFLGWVIALVWASMNEN